MLMVLRLLGTSTCVQMQDSDCILIDSLILCESESLKGEDKFMKLQCKYCMFCQVTLRCASSTLTGFIQDYLI